MAAASLFSPVADVAVDFVQEGSIGLYVHRNQGYKDIKDYWGRGSWGSGNLYLTPTCYSVTTRMTLH